MGSASRYNLLEDPDLARASWQGMAKVSSSEKAELHGPSLSQDVGINQRAATRACITGRELQPDTRSTLLSPTISDRFLHMECGAIYFSTVQSCVRANNACAVLRFSRLMELSERGKRPSVERARAALVGLVEILPRFLGVFCWIFIKKGPLRGATEMNCKMARRGWLTAGLEVGRDSITMTGG